MPFGLFSFQGEAGEMKDGLLSVGIDIGTSTTQLVFSRIHIENTASLMSIPRVQIVDKTIVYRSAIHFTPLKSATEIDGDAVRKIVAAEYEKAGVRPEDVETGAVIITGETARKENAARVQKRLSAFAGDFVVATAGPALEGIIAGKGAGACAVSKKKGAVVANLDIGGGTTNIAVFSNGEVIDTCCLDIGGRLVKVEKGKIVYISDKIRRLCAVENIPLEVGDVADPGILMRLSTRLAELLEEVVGIRAKTPELDLMATDRDLEGKTPITHVSISGGVADCIHAEPGEMFRFGDMGLILGRAIGESALCRKRILVAATETIRATVVGAGSHTMDVSGSTISVSDTVLPIQNLPVLKLSREDEARPFAVWDAVIRQKLDWFRMEAGELAVPALAFLGRTDLGFAEIEALADAILSGMEDGLGSETPLIVVVERDLAKVLGNTLMTKRPHRDIVCIDTVCVENGDYIDIGKPVAAGRVVPVVVKTLLFSY